MLMFSRLRLLETSLSMRVLAFVTSLLLLGEKAHVSRASAQHVEVVTPAATLRSNLELTLPMDGSSPVLDLRSDVSSFDIAAVSRYLPANKMPPTVVAWLDDALRGGRVT